MAQPAFVRHACSNQLLASGRSLECGTIKVPENWRSGTTRFVRLPVVVVRARRSVEPSRVPVIYLHGGPGGQVLAYLAEALDDEMGRELIAADQDWVFFDQRGTGGSMPRLDCGDLALNDAGPASEGVVRQLQTCVQGFRRSGIDFSQYHSRAIARDIQAIRSALDIGDFDLYGYSYGTRVASAVLVHEPAGLRAIIMDSPWPPEALWAESGPAWVSHEVREVLALCAADDRCAAYGNLDDELDQLITAWRSPTGKDVESVQMLALFLMESLYDREAVRRLPRLLSRLIAGDRSDIQPYAMAGAGYAEAQHMAVLCNEEFPFEDAMTVRANASGDPIAEAVALTMENYFEACRLFDHAAPAAVEQLPVKTDVPTLFIAAGIDAGCPAEFSESAVKGYSQGQLLIFANSTHQPPAHSACARSLVRNFLAHPERVLDRACIEDDLKPIQFN